MFKMSQITKARKAIILVVISILFSVNSMAQTTSVQNADEESKVKTSLNQKAQEKKELKNSNPTLANLAGGVSGWRFMGSLSHTPKLRRDQEDTSDILLRADYSINNKHSLRFQQFFTKFYGKYQSEYEFKPFDTSLAHFYRMDWKPYGIGLQWRNQVTLPISNESARDDLYTNFQTSFVGTKALMGGKLIVFGIPYARYFFYEYKTSVSGRLLPRFQAGASLAGLYFFNPKLSLYAGGDYRVDTVYNSQFDQNARQIPLGTYRFDLSMSYQWNANISTSLDYFQGRASYIQSGRYELVLFDDQASRIGASLTYVY